MGNHLRAEQRTGETSNVKRSRQNLQIMNPLQTETSHGFVFDLMKKMNAVDCNHSEVYDKMDDNVPLIVVCPKVSRLQPDVDLAVQSVRRTTPYVVIILHIGSERNLPTVPSKEKLHTYESITFIDMGCNYQGAIYKCQHNTEAIGQLRSYIGDTGTNHPETSTPGSSWNRDQSSRRSNGKQSSLRATQPQTLPLKLLSDSPWRPFSKSGDELQESVMNDIKELDHLNVLLILLLGPVGAGKSSFINSCLSVSAGRKKALAKTGSAVGKSSLTVQHKNYRDDGLLKHIRLVDSMGFEPSHGHGLHTDDIVNLLQGHVKKTYTFDPSKAMTNESEFYRKNPKLEHETHCVVFVLDARKIPGGIQKEYIEKIKLLQDKIKDVPRALILTHVDMLCDEVKKDASSIFRSLKVAKAMETASAVFGIELASIHPVINYEEDFELTTAKNIPILLAIRQIMQYACDRVEQVENKSESESRSENGSD